MTTSARWTLSVFVLFGAGVLVVACDGARSTDDEPDRVEGARAAEELTLELEVVPAKEEYIVGDVIQLVLHLKNVSGRPQGLPLTKGPDGFLPSWHFPVSIERPIGDRGSHVFVRCALNFRVLEETKRADFREGYLTIEADGELVAESSPIVLSDAGEHLLSTFLSVKRAMYHGSRAVPVETDPDVAKKYPGLPLMTSVPALLPIPNGWSGTVGGRAAIKVNAEPPAERDRWLDAVSARITRADAPDEEQVLLVKALGAEENVYAAGRLAGLLDVVEDPGVREVIVAELVRLLEPGISDEAAPRLLDIVTDPAEDIDVRRAAAGCLAPLAVRDGFRFNGFRYTRAPEKPKKRAVETIYRIQKEGPKELRDAADKARTRYEQK